MNEQISENISFEEKPQIKFLNIFVGSYFDIQIFMLFTDTQL